MQMSVLIKIRWSSTTHHCQKWGKVCFDFWCRLEVRLLRPWTFVYSQLFVTHWASVHFLTIMTIQLSYTLFWMSSQHLWFNFLIEFFLVFFSFSLSLILIHSRLFALFSFLFHSLSLTHLLVSFAIIRRIFNFLYVVAKTNKLQTISSMMLVNFGGRRFLWIQAWSLNTILGFANKS
jgi:hypothetical protein